MSLQQAKQQMMGLNVIPVNRSVTTGMGEQQAFLFMSKRKRD